MKALILSFFGILYGITVIAQTNTGIPPFPTTREKDESVPTESTDQEPSSKPDKPSSSKKETMITDPVTGGVLWAPEKGSEMYQYLKGLFVPKGRLISKAVPTPPSPEITGTPSEQIRKKKSKNTAERYYKARNGGVLWVPEKGTEFYRYLEGLFAAENYEDGSRNPLSDGTDFYGIPFTTGSSNGSVGYWHYQYDLGGEGDDLVKSASIPEGGNSWLALNMTTGQNEAYAIRFKWKVSCYPLNELRFVYNVIHEEGAMSGYPDWDEFIGVIYHPQGSPMSHELQWVYEKNSHFVGGSDAGFLDGFKVVSLILDSEHKISYSWSIDRTYVDLFWPIDVEYDYQLESKSWSTLLWAVESAWNQVTTPVDGFGPFLKTRYYPDGDGMRWFRLKRID
ncbi:MAG: hypothetical protein H8E20_14660 [Verrucomicrobia bacterium]|nr:hypothetical protein [Verrucomicrobiota bacterium]